MSIKITKAEHDALPDSLKSKFTADGDAFALIEEDVEGLKKSKADILQEKKELAAKLNELEKFKAEHDARASAAEEEKLKEAGKFKELEERYKQRIADMETAHQAETAKLLSTVKTEKLTNFLVSKGVEANRAKYALSDTADQFDIESGEQGFTLKLKTGIGDAKELDGVVAKLKESSPFLFASSNASGSGASASNGNGNGADYSKLSAEDKIAAGFAAKQ